MNRAQLIFTKLWLRLMGARFAGISTVCHDGPEMKVVTFTSKKPLVLGQVTPFSTITIHEIVFQSECLLRYVITHESIHKKQWYRYLIYPLIPVCLLSAAGMTVYLILVILVMIQSRGLVSPLLPVGALFTILFLVALPCGFSWLLELSADFGAIRKLGRQGFLDAVEDARELTKATGLPRLNLFYWMVNRMTHPTSGITLRLYELTNKARAQRVDNCP